jgi:CheY-like chemotaxis protein
MRQAAKRGERLTKQLLAFSRRHPLRPEPIDLPRQLRSMCDLLARSLRGDIHLVADFPADLRSVEVDPGQLELAFLNVGLNARDAMPDGGTLHVSARNLALDGTAGALEGEYVAIELRDAGTGMTEEVRARAFEPFFTTKEIGRGSGLGLSQAFGFAKQSGGTLTLESTVGKGTTVTFYLPAMPLRSASEAKQEAGGEPAPGPVGAKILLVEDEAGVAELALGLLEGAGFTVTLAENAMAALEVLAGGAHIDLLFSDIMMPGRMNGAELARVVRRDYPHVFILLATGYADAATNRLAQEFPLITKPYGRTALLDKLTKILGDGR